MQSQHSFIQGIQKNKSKSKLYDRRACKTKVNCSQYLSFNVNKHGTLHCPATSLKRIIFCLASSAETKVFFSFGLTWELRRKEAFSNNLKQTFWWVIFSWYKMKSCKWYEYLLRFVNFKISPCFFSMCVFFHEHSQFAEQQRKREAISLTLLFHFLPECINTETLVVDGLTTCGNQILSRMCNFLQRMMKMVSSQS